MKIQHIYTRNIHQEQAKRYIEFYSLITFWMFILWVVETLGDLDAPSRSVEPFRRLDNQNIICEVYVFMF